LGYFAGFAVAPEHRYRYHERDSAALSPDVSLREFNLNLRRAQRRTVKCLPFLWVMLGIAVFAWGLQYKLSLYPGELAVPHRVPTAKLLANDKQQGTAQANLGQYLPESGPRWAVTARLLPCLALLIGAMLLLALRRYASSVFWLCEAFPPALRGSSSLFFRPPPALIPALLR